MTNQKIGYQEEVRALLSQNASDLSRKGEIIFIGSSIFRLWKTLSSDMQPLPILNQAFGGSRTWEVLAYVDRLVIPYQPKIIVYYCGSNDINAGEDATGIKQRFKMFVDRVRIDLPETIIFFVSINRAPQKQQQWHIVDAANYEISQYCQTSSLLEYIDVNPAIALFDRTGKPRLGFFQSDGVHLKPIAYREFTKIIKPILENVWNEQCLV